MINWRKPTIKFLLKITGSKIFDYFSVIKSLEKESLENLEKFQKDKLVNLLSYACENVPYYSKILKSAGVVSDKGLVNLKNFKNIPILTKKILRKNDEDLISKNLPEQKKLKHLCTDTPDHNHSGGSTGQPVDFLQDQNYRDWNIANKMYYKIFENQDIGAKELRLWGSERDLLQGKETLYRRLHNFLYNRKDLNAFKMSKQDMDKYIEIINKFKPSWIEGYVQPVYEFAKYIESKKIKIYCPKGIIVSAGTLYPQFKKIIEKVFKTKVLNRYGSREVGDIACSCFESEELHLSVWNHYLEILDDNLNPVKPGETGKVYVTTLNNFSMPLIRYDIGDYAAFSQDGKVCKCGRTTPKLAKVEGREMSVFKTKTGKIVPAEFFIHFIGVVYNTGFISKFQVIQKDYDLIEIKVVIKKPEQFEKKKDNIISSIKRVMGPNCQVTFTKVEDIEPSSSGKYLYTICEVG